MMDGLVIQMIWISSSEEMELIVDVYHFLCKFTQLNSNEEVEMPPGRVAVSQLKVVIQNVGHYQKEQTESDRGPRVWIDL